MRIHRSLRSLVLVLAALLAVPALASGAEKAAPAMAPKKAKAARRAITRDERAQILAVLHVEEVWLRARTAKAVAPLLAADFAEPVSTGLILSKRQHLAWRAKHPKDPSLRRRFSHLKIRLLGKAVAVVNGRIDARDVKGHLVRQTMFTDVLQRVHGRWLAVSAQETPVTGPKTKRPVHRK